MFTVLLASIVTNTSVGKHSYHDDSVSDPCSHNTRTVPTAVKGTVTWAEDAARCAQSATWVLQPPKDQGLVLEFPKVLTTLTSLLTVTWNCSQCHLTTYSSEATKSERLYNSRQHRRLFNRTNYEEYDVSPFLVRETAIIAVETEESDEENRQLSVMRITYSAHLLRDMPHRVNYEEFQHKKTKVNPHVVDVLTSRNIYNCSAVVPSSQLPAALLCDGVAHCFYWEDERDCDYIRNPSQPTCTSVHKLRLLYGLNPLPIRHTYCVGLVIKNDLAESSFLPNNVMELTGRDFFGYGDIPDQSSFNLMHNLIVKSGVSSSFIALWNSPSVVKDKRLRHLYRFVWHWKIHWRYPAAYRHPVIPRRRFQHGCAILFWVPVVRLKPISCFKNVSIASLLVTVGISHEHRPSTGLHLSRPDSRIQDDKFDTKECSDESVVHSFHPCPGLEREKKAGVSEGRQMHAMSPSGFPLYNCLYGPPVHYTVLCDGVWDCVDGSDEMQCQTTANLPRLFYTCQTISQFVKDPLQRRCDGVPHCLDGTDEDNCHHCQHNAAVVNVTHCPVLGCLPKHLTVVFTECGDDQSTLDDYGGNKISCCNNAQTSNGLNSSTKLEEPPTVNSCDSEVNGTAVVWLDGFGMSCLSPVTSATNTEGLFYCSVGDYYIPSYMINNGVWDCYHGEDEGIPADNITCPGFYRCHDTGSCLHPDLVCDGIIHCPNRDDELYCDKNLDIFRDCSCPNNSCATGSSHCCNCEGLACVCNAEKIYSKRQYEDHVPHFMSLRLLHMVGLPSHKRDRAFLEFKHLKLLQFLNISFLNIEHVHMKDLPQLKVLDMSFNHVSNLNSISLNLDGLTHLYLSGNPLVTELDSSFSFSLAALKRLQYLAISNSNLHVIEMGSFTQFKTLITLDISDNNLKFVGMDIFQGLDNLGVLFTDDPKLCCPLFHNKKRVECHAPVDELSSCDDLLRSDAFRFFLWVFSLLALLGNGGVLVYRLYTYKHTISLPFRLMVINLCASDMIMGVYMLMIGVADAAFRGSYVEQESEWRASRLCTAAGFLALLSSEVSVLVVCLITLDRVLTICFPFKYELHLSRGYANS